MRRWIDGFTIRARITAGTLAIALVVSAIAGILLYADVSSIIRDSTVQLLHSDLAPLEAAIRRAPTDPDIRAGEDQLAALINPSGHVVVSNLPDSLEDRFSELRLLHETPQQVGSGRQAYLVMVESISTAHGSWKAIVARSLRPGDLVLRQLGLTMLIGALVLFASLGVASWVLSGAALRPVSRMRREAERLGTVNAAGVLPVGRARDELAALAVTLNEFLERNRQSIDHERQMVSDASHELRTPLAVLVAQLDEATDIGDDRAAQLVAIANASRTAARLSRLTTNLLELSKLDANDAPEHATWAQLVREVSQSIDRARVLAHPRSVDVDFTVGDGDDAAVFDVSAGNFGRLIDNLVSNSIAASDEHGSVLVSLVRGGSTLQLDVRDDGTGVPEEFIPVAFDRFSRADSARPTYAGGSGLGLAIVAAIVDRARGTIELRNLDRGALVRVVLPASGTRG
jgi:signal transduction histidine kinase